MRYAGVSRGIAALSVCAGGLVHGAEPADVEAFEREVRPILAAHCYGCHGPDQQKAGLRLDHIAMIREGGDNGPALMPGDPASSRLITAIGYDDVDLQMPPRGKLSDADIATLTKWVASGAPWPDEPVPAAGAAPEVFQLAARRDSHWAWQPITDPAVPAVTDTAWPRNDIDRFLLARLETEGLEPAAPADAATWLRRVTFDITGLPPSPEDVQAFLADPSEAAHAAAVDRLLASPRFGEHWGRHWLDLTRYAETHGQEQDFPIPEAWRYRDYVIRAFNADVPYDQLVREHIAGDLLPEPRRHPEDSTNESIIGTGFWFMYQAQHAPVDVRKDYADRIDNQIDVMSKAFMAMTVSCARCHDHKFDAISDEDYYALTGILRSSRREFAELDPHGARRRIATGLAEAKAKGASDLIGAWRTALRGPERGQIVAVNTDGQAADQVARWLESIRAVPAPETVKQPAADSAVFASFGNGYGEWEASGLAFGAGPTGPGAWVIDEGKPHLVQAGVAHSGEVSTALTGVLRSPTFRLDAPRIQIHAAGRKAQVRLVIEGYHIREYHQLLFESAYLDVNHGPELQWLEIAQGLDKYQGCEVYIELYDGGEGYIAVDEIRLATEPLRDVPADSLWTRVVEPLGATPLNHRLAAAAVAWAEGRATDDDASLLNTVGDGEIHPVSTATAIDACAEMEANLPEPVRILAMADGNGLDEPLLIRGNAHDAGPVVARRFLEAVDPAPITTSSSGRLQLAEAMLDADNPLTARVAVNRVWHHLFGQGIVPSVDNFGVLGQPPSHPELLDYLAMTYRRDGWSTKRLIREIVLSSAYRMSSRAEDPAAEERDPANALLHRMNLRRLPAESIRDAVLVSSGTMNDTMFGKSVPAYLSPFMGGHRRPSTSGPLNGDRRRSIYLEVRRNFLPSLLMAFDFPAPDTAHGQRNVSNVPAQALILMNDPFVVEQTRVWGEAMAAQTDTPFEDRVAAVYLRAFGRYPDDVERERVAAFFAEQAAVYGLDAEQSRRDGRVWADLCHALVTVKEFAYLG